MNKATKETIYRQRSTDPKTAKKHGQEDTLCNGLGLYPISSFSLLIVTGTALHRHCFSRKGFVKGWNSHDQGNFEQPGVCDRMRGCASCSADARPDRRHTEPDECAAPQ